jgi:prolyl-tRNA editing enzyme YbaK/EbsC (Cys-tRNA(Pro) deacylase)
LPVFLDEKTAQHEEIVINAGARGTMIRLSTADLIRLTGAMVADIRAE